MDDEKKEDLRHEDEKQQQDSITDNYEFLKETIKERPIDKKKLARHAGFLAAGGVLFGLVAALTFAYVEPKIEKNMQRKEVPYVNIPGDEEPGTQEEQSSEDNGQEEPQTGDNTGEDSQTAQAEPREITLDDYENLYTEILKQAEEPKKAMVTVIGSKKDEDWFQTPYENQISGLIVADNGQEMFILTEYRIVENVDRIQVVFCDGSMVDARFQKADKNTGFTILKVPVSDIPAETKERIITAPLGNSYGLNQGEPVIAIGSPMGYSDSIAYGVVTSTTNSVSKVDAEYGILTTDIVGSGDGSGILVNLKGEVVGVIAQSFAKADTKNIITGLSISQTKDLIENLSNNKDIIYMGITGQTITTEISEKKGIPKGVFVEGVEVDSPAMQADIRNADVIVEVNKEKVETVKGYQQQLKSCKAGSVIEVKAMRQGTEGYVEVTFEVTLGAL